MLELHHAHLLSFLPLLLFVVQLLDQTGTVARRAQAGNASSPSAKSAGKLSVHSSGSQQV